MSEFRMDNNTKEYYTSFVELAAAWKCKPVNRQTKDKKKLESQREKFCNRHLCKACKYPMTLMLDTNTMYCSNDKCKGIPMERIDKEGNKIITYKPSFELLDDLGAEIGNNIFS